MILSAGRSGVRVCCGQFGHGRRSRVWACAVATPGRWWGHHGVMSAIIVVIMIYKDADIVNNSINILLHCDPNCDKHGINQGISSHRVLVHDQSWHEDLNKTRSETEPLSWLIWFSPEQCWLILLVSKFTVTHSSLMLPLSCYYNHLTASDILNNNRLIHQPSQPGW